jgi:glutamate dehydrogenase
MHRDVAELLQRETIWMLRNIPATQPLSEVVPLYREGIDSLRGTFSTLVSPVEKQLVESRIGELTTAMVPLDVAEDVGVAPVITAVTDIVRIASETNLPVDAVAGAFFAAGQAAGIDRLRAAAGRIALPAHWDRLALQRINDDLFSCQRALASKALVHLDRSAGFLKRKDGAEAVNRWAATSQGPLDQAHALIGDLERTGPFNIAKLTLAVGQLRDLAGV